MYGMGIDFAQLEYDHNVYFRLGGMSCMGLPRRLTGVSSCLKIPAVQARMTALTPLHLKSWIPGSRERRRTGTATKKTTVKEGFMGNDRADAELQLLAL